MTGARTIRLVFATIGVLALASPAADAGAAPAPTWVRAMPRVEAAAVDVSPTGVTFVAGTRTAGVDSELFVRAFGPAGVVLWTRAWRPGPTSDDTWARGEAVAAAPDGPVTVGGLMGLPAPVGEWVLARYASDGALRWRAARPGWRSMPYPGSVVDAVAASRTRVIVGVNDEGCCDDGYVDGWLRAFTVGGRALWTRNLELPGVPHSTFDRVADIAIGDGVIYVVATVNRLPWDDPDDPVDDDVVVQARSMDGALLWSRTIAEPGRDMDEATSIAFADGRLLVGATMEAWGSPDGPRGWVGRFGVRGRPIETWSWRDVAVFDVAVTQAGATFVARGDGLLRLDPDGTRAWLVPVPSSWGSGVAVGGHGVSLLVGTWDEEPRSELWRFPG